MDKYDKLREQVIKGSRDVQKLSKQSIFSVHRSELQNAHQQLDKATEHALPLLAIVEQQPTLRKGAFSNSLEEWAEAALCCEWLEHKRIMTMPQMERMKISVNEYVGALSDFTGEICRLAVVAASHRQAESVREVHDCVIVIAAAMMQLNVSSKFNKKMEAVNNTLRKMEDIMYAVSYTHLTLPTKRIV
eukprot:TRINITY_DN31077_c0_g1_i2.p1 TRINITY_DN31077_c0_g1~~TRINITY_DN31077_c0_g1_i2.p1  ORF type:complete len:189 (+),score=40.36 TRINITY_DN31077_c0_g1_i2:193-759(+)